MEVGGQTQTERQIKRVWSEAQWLRELAFLSEDMGLIPSTYNMMAHNRLKFQSQEI